MDPAAEQIESTEVSGVEGKRRGGVISRIKADLGMPPQRGLRSAVGFALSCALVAFGAVAFAVTGEEPKLPLVTALAGQWFLALADVLPVRFLRTAPALRVLCLGLLVAAGIGWWLA